jgi:hypothetical protein
MADGDPRLVQSILNVVAPGFQRVSLLNIVLVPGIDGGHAP